MSWTYTLPSGGTMSDDPSEPMTARVPRELADRIRALAAAGDRTVGRQIVRLLRLGLAADAATRPGPPR